VTPYVERVENGLQYRAPLGTDPADRSAWEPVNGGAPLEPLADFYARVIRTGGPW
jgi:hypothetical protein